MSDHDIQVPTDVRVPANHPWRRYERLGLMVGGGALLVSVGLATMDAAQFYYSYLIAFMYCLSIALGGLFFVLAHHATKSDGGIVLRRLAENLMGTLPIFALLFIPILAGLHHHHLFHHWTSPHDALVEGKTGYLNIPFFYIRALIYLGAWALMARFFRGRSVAQDESGDPAVTRLLIGRSYPGIAVFALTMSFAAFDWIMTHDPHFYSTILGVYYFAGIGVSLYATLSLLVVRANKAGLLTKSVSVEHRHALGKMLFGFTVFWSYIAFSQFLLIWYANIPEETVWYAKRIAGGYMGLTIVIALAHFAIPFFFLMGRTIKRNPRTLQLGACWLLIIHYFDLYWLVMPVLHEGDLHFSILDLTTVIAVGGLFLAFFFRLLVRTQLIPIKDPLLARSIAYEN